MLQTLRILGREINGSVRALLAGAGRVGLAAVVVVAAMSQTGRLVDRVGATGDGHRPEAPGEALPPQPPTTAPTTPPERPGTFAFSATDPDGDPVRFDPCRPLSIVYEAAGEPYDARADVQRAVARLEDAMERELGFQTGGSVDGPTVSVGWVATWQELPGEPSDTTVGTGGFNSFGDTARAGHVTLAADAQRRPGFVPGGWGAVLLHELGHAVGLDHVDDPDELMFPTVRDSRPARWGPGDLLGLADLGGPCIRRG